MLKPYAVCFFIPSIFLAACGDLGSVETAPGQFRVYASGWYVGDADVQRAAAKACPRGYTTVSRIEGKGTADVLGDLLMEIVCNSKNDSK